MTRNFFESDPASQETILPTKALLCDAVAERDYELATRLVKRLPTEWEEIRFLYPEFLRRTLLELVRRAESSSAIERLRTRLESELGADYEALEAQSRLDRDYERLAASCQDGTGSAHDIDRVFTTWRELHDRWRDLLAEAIDLAVRLLGEDQLGDLWERVQADEIDGYGRYDPATRPWSESFEEAVQSAISGMRGHLCGPRLDGEIGFSDHGDHVELRFEPCGSGGRLRSERRFGVTRAQHDWAWNRTGVCYYCAHCCVLQQLTPIDRFGIPVRVVNPPTAPGASCSWRVYRTPEAVPDSAYLDVGRHPPSARGRSD